MFDTAWGKVCECESETGAFVNAVRETLYEGCTYEMCSVNFFSILVNFIKYARASTWTIC